METSEHHQRAVDQCQVIEEVVIASTELGVGISEQPQPRQRFRPPTAPAIPSVNSGVALSACLADVRGAL